MSNYQGIHIGTFDTREEAIYARLKKEKELCGEFGPNARRRIREEVSD